MPAELVTAPLLGCSSWSSPSPRRGLTSALPTAALETAARGCTRPGASLQSMAHRVPRKASQAQRGGEEAWLFLPAQPLEKRTPGSRCQSPQKAPHPNFPREKRRPAANAYQGQAQREEAVGWACKAWPLPQRIQEAFRGVLDPACEPEFGGPCRQALGCPKQGSCPHRTLRQRAQCPSLVPQEQGCGESGCTIYMATWAR